MSRADFFGPYRVLRRLASGGAGVVYLAERPGQGQTVAIKTLGAGAAATEAQRTRFEREVAALKLLSHPSIVPILDSGDQPSPWLAMRYVEGESLASLIGQRRLDLDEVYSLGAQLSSALRCAHAAGILHRDVKPDNVLCDHFGRFLLTDFGLAKHLEASGEALTRSGLLQGTPGYWAPEQASGQGKSATEATDVYGLGAVLYAALTRTPPVKGTSLHEILVATLSRAPTPPSQLAGPLPRALEDLVLACLAKEGADRPSLGRVEAWLEECQVPARRSRGRRGLLALALCVLGLGGLLGIWTGLAPSAGRGKGAKQSSSQGASPAGELVARAKQALERPSSAGHQEGVRLLREAVAKGQAEAASLLAECLSEGRGVARDEAEALRLLRWGAELNEPHAQLSLGSRYDAGEGVAPSARRAFELYQAAARGGLALANSKLGHCYARGRGAPVDLAAAERHYRVAAEAGGLLAAYDLGALLAQEGSSAAQRKEGLEWLSRAARGGHAEAMLLFGQRLIEGADAASAREAGLVWIERAAASDEPRVERAALWSLADELQVLPQGNERALRWWRLAADLGHAKARLKLAICLEGGLGTERDLPGALRWYKASAKLGETKAMIALGLFAKRGLLEAPNAPLALRWYRRAAEAGDAEGRFRLGSSLLRGLPGVEADPVQGVALIREAAEEWPEARGSLAQCYERGLGVESDPVEALRWYRRAAEAGTSSGLYALGGVYLEGRLGVERDEVKALGYLIKGARAGSGRSATLVGALILNGSKACASHQLKPGALEARRWFTRGVVAGDALGQANLAMCYEQGLGGAADPEQARRLYRAALENPKASVGVKTKARTGLARLGP